MSDPKKLPVVEIELKAHPVRGTIKLDGVELNGVRRIELIGDVGHPPTEVTLTLMPERVITKFYGKPNVFHEGQVRYVGYRNRPWYLVRYWWAKITWRWWGPRALAGLGSMGRRWTDRLDEEQRP